MGTLGFSYVGFLFLCCLLIPNILYGLHLPVDHTNSKENRILLLFERSGQALSTILLLIFDNFNFHPAGLWTIWLGSVFVLLLVYLICWGRYFSGAHLSRDFYRPFWGIPLPLAVLPVAAELLLAVYGRVIWLGIAAVILGIGHIGITAQNWNAIKKQADVSRKK